MCIVSMGNRDFPNFSRDLLTDQHSLIFPYNLLFQVLLNLIPMLLSSALRSVLFYIYI